MQTSKDPRSTGSLLSDVLNSIGNLLRQEVDLARAEVDENLKRAARALALIVVGLVLLFIALTVLVTTAVSALVLAGVAEILATLIIGVITLVAAIIFAVIGVKRLKLSSLAPSRAARNIKRDAAMMKEAYNDR